MSETIGLNKVRGGRKDIVTERIIAALSLLDDNAEREELLLTIENIVVKSTKRTRLPEQACSQELIVNRNEWW